MVKPFHYRPKNGCNFGDEIAVVLISEMARSRLLNLNQRPGRLFSIGSIVHLSKPDDIIWGSGINGKVELPTRPLASDIRAVRGPLTKRRLEKLGYDVPDIFGDPAILAPKYLEIPEFYCHTPKTVIVPNYNDFELVYSQLGQLPNQDEFLLVHPYTHWSFLIGALRSAASVVASSLHAIIFADLFGKPNALLGGSKYAEHPFKYRDYTASLGCPDPIFFSDVETALENLSPARNVPNEMCDSLEQSFPVDRFEPAVTENALGRSQRSE